MRHSRCFIFGLLLSTAAMADVVHLRDGSTIEGDLKHTEQGWQVTTPAGAVRELSADDVVSIDVGSPARSGNLLARLDSLRKSTVAVTDPRQAIAQYDNFLKNAAGTSAEAPARADLALWQKRLADGYVKQGSEWMLPADAEQVRHAAMEKAVSARQLLRSGRTIEAVRLLDETLALDPANITAIYLKALTDAPARPADARQALVRLNELVPNHGPTLNNLAVLNWQMRQWTVAIGFYEQAMNASPVNQTILDNMAEAMETLPGDVSRAQVVGRANRLFNEQDRLLQADMAEQGYQRWGGTYISNAELAVLREKEAEVQRQLDQYAADFNELDRRIREIDAQADRNEASMHEIERSRWVRDYTGRWIRLGYPSIYYELQAENRRLNDERNEALRRQEELRIAADTVRQSLPIAKFTGVQKLIGVEGAPFAGQPTTQTIEPADDEPVLEIEVTGPPAD